jgi:hypothetical protein
MCLLGWFAHPRRQWEACHRIPFPEDGPVDRAVRPSSEETATEAINTPV